MSNHIIGIDTGNRCIKTASHVFVAGVKSSERLMSFQHGVIRYKGKYYMLSQERVAYLQDKTETDEYFVMALFAMLKELKARNVDLSVTVTVDLGVGLPPSHLSRLKGRFCEYFNRGLVTFEYDNMPVRIDINSVRVFSQGYAAIYKDYDTISNYGRAYIVDIGGYTTDVISLNYGQIDPSFCESLDMGLIHLYNKISWDIHSKYGFIPAESQIDTVLQTGREISANAPILDIVNDKVNAYLSELIRKLSEYGVSFKFSKGIFVGGGSERFRHWIEKSEDIYEPYFIHNINANAQGYEAFLTAICSQS